MYSPARHRLDNVLFGQNTGAGRLLGLERQGLALDFLTDTAIVRWPTGTQYQGKASTGLMTYTSSSAKMVMGATGLLASSSTVLPLEYTAAGLPRGLLIEEARTNIARRSENFTDAVWTAFAASVTNDQTTAPDGASTADLFTESTANNAHCVYGTTFSITSGTTYTASIFVKAGTARYISLRSEQVGPGSDYYWTTFDTTNLTFNSTGGASPSYVSYGNGWYRIALPWVAHATGNANIVIAGSDVSTAPAFNSDLGNSYLGTSKTFYIWGAQVEAGAFPSSYIPTTSASVTRNSDDITLAATLFPYSATEGTLVAAFEPISVAAARRAVQIDDGTENERVTLGSNATPEGAFTVIDGGASQAALTTGTPAALTACRTAASWAVNDFAQMFNGALLTVDTGGTLPTMTTLRLGSGVSAASQLNGWLRQLVYIPRAMEDSELRVVSRL